MGATPDKPNSGAAASAPARSASPSAAALAADGTSFRDLTRFAFKHMILIALVTILVTAAASGLAMVLPASYTANGMLLVEYGKSPTIRSEPTTWPLQSAEMVETESEVLKSRSVAEAVVDKLQLDKLPQKLRKPTTNQVKLALYKVQDFVKDVQEQLMDWNLTSRIPRHEKAIRALQSSLKIKQPALTVMLKVTYSAQDPVLAERVVRTVIDTYLEKRREIYADDTASFFLQRAEETQKELDQAREALTRETEQPQTDRIKLQIRALEASYLFYKEKYDRGRSDAAADRSLVNVRVVDYPRVPEVRTLDPLVVMILGLVGGFVLAVGLALVLEYFDNTVYMPSDLSRRLDVPVLGSVRHTNGARWLLRTRGPRPAKGPKKPQTPKPSKPDATAAAG
ncbi:MAG: Wzz/FepE/Etk N-terminal domain-containing protein [Planctomycetota bacterium]|nr:Wzz/FepE/Etk N-terminal domain-containing protein [Planctomycetota bacterium]